MGGDPLEPYREHAAIERAIDALGARARVDVVGHSVEGRPIRAVEIGRASARDVTVVLAGIHAMEWIGVECAIALIEALAARVPDDRRVVVFPVVNVDGYAAVERDLRRGARRFRRGNARGVDLNRNWPTHFRPPSAFDRALPVYRPGPAARSEPEVAAVLDRIDALVARGARVSHALSLHSFGEKILFPYGGLWRRPPRVSSLLSAANAVNFRFATPYGVVQCARWVPGAFAHGMELDHLHDALGALSLLVECSPGGFSVSDPSTWVAPFRWFNPRDPERVVRHLLPGLEWFARGASA